MKLKCLYEKKPYTYKGSFDFYIDSGPVLYYPHIAILGDDPLFEYSDIKNPPTGIHKWKYKMYTNSIRIVERYFGTRSLPFQAVI